MNAIAILLTITAIDPDSTAAFADRAKLAEANHYVYATVSNQRSQQAKDRLAGQLAFIAPSLSSKSYLGDQLPVHVPGTDLYRLDLTGLGWERTWPAVVTTHYPYRPDLGGRWPLVVRADWMVAELVDAVRTKDAQYQLLYGKAITTAKEFNAFWKIQGDKEFFYGKIEGRSGVANELVRLIENQPAANRTSAWVTFDSRLVAGASDPLETLGKKLKSDASELIAAIPKHYDGKTGALSAYLLADQKGNRQNKAPADIVTDHSGIRGPEIINSISCIACHAPAAGLIDPTIDAYREYITGGAKVFADKQTKRAIQQYLESDFAKEIARGREDYTAAVEMCNGLTPEKNAANFIACVKAYDAPVDLAQAAREVYSTPDELRLAIADYALTGKLSARLAALAHDQPLSRDQWIANQHLVQCIVLPTWRKK